MSQYFDQLAALHARSATEDVPNVSLRNGMFLYLMTKLLRPQRILEVGTANGVSALFFAKALKELGTGDITTIDCSKPTSDEGLENFKSFGVDDLITFHFGDAKEIIPTLEGTFDLIFVDARKKHYKIFLEQCLTKVSEGGVIIFDDVMKFRHKMEGFYEAIEEGGYTHVTLPIDEDDGILVLLPQPNQELPSWLPSLSESS